MRISRTFALLCKDIVKRERKVLGEIQYIFVNVDEILQINRTYLNHHYFTDVITFDRSGKRMINGDIFICPVIVFENALEYNATPGNELARVMIHGLLHLIGYQDHTEELRLEMRQKENLYLSLGAEKNYIGNDDR